MIIYILYIKYVKKKMSLNKISRTAGFLSYDVIDSDEENKPLKDIFVSIKDRLPKPNPLFQ